MKDDTTEAKPLIHPDAEVLDNPVKLAIPDNVAVLDTPVKRGSSEITQVTVRKPSSGELRGLHLSELLQLDVASLIKLVPRITELTEQEVAKLEPADLVEIGTKVIDFLVQKRTKTAASLVA